MPEFVEFAGKKEYKCPRCKAPIRYAKFFGDDQKILTTDGKEPYFDNTRKPMSNTGWPTDADTKQMHECKGDNRGNTSELKTDVGHNSHTLQAKEFPLDKLIIKKQIEEDNKLLPLLYARYENIRHFLKGLGEDNPAMFGMFFNQMLESDNKYE